MVASQKICVKFYLIFIGGGWISKRRQQIKASSSKQYYVCRSFVQSTNDATRLCALLTKELCCDISSSGSLDCLEVDLSQDCKNRGFKSSLYRANLSQNSIELIQTEQATTTTMFIAYSASLAFDTQDTRL